MAAVDPLRMELDLGSRNARFEYHITTGLGIAAIRLPAQLFQQPVMRTKRRTKGWVFQIGQAKFPGGLFNNGGNGRVMHVTDSGKQVVLDLPVQAPA